ncbi:hypothetical protein V1512DRAFT_272512 [Lipomyces arxii]|uniref:uncharacterized protein n=1 Tax=Lipomyces arxii TaxID=56418 RepID=UPI0034CE1CF6
METDVERRLRTGEYDDEEEEITAVKGQIKQVNYETKNMTQDSVARANQALEHGMRTVAMLHEQGNILINSGKTVNRTQQSAIVADENLEELKAANRSMFMPDIKNPFSSKPYMRERALNRLAADNGVLIEQGIINDHYVNDIADRVNKVDIRNRRGPAPDAEALHNAQREKQRQANKHSMFEPDEDDLTTEDSIQQGLNDLTIASHQLNIVANAINNQLDEQNRRVEHMSSQTGDVEIALSLQTNRMKAYHK